MLPHSPSDWPRFRKPEWLVYAKPSFGGPASVLAYLNRSAHRVAILNTGRVSAVPRAAIPRTVTPGTRVRTGLAPTAQGRSSPSKYPDLHLIRPPAHRPNFATAYVAPYFKPPTIADPQTLTRRSNVQSRIIGVMSGLRPGFDLNSFQITTRQAHPLSRAYSDCTAPLCAGSFESHDAIMQFDIFPKKLKVRRCVGPLTMAADALSRNAPSLQDGLLEDTTVHSGFDLETYCIKVLLTKNPS